VVTAFTPWHGARLWRSLAQVALDWIMAIVYCVVIAVAFCMAVVLVVPFGPVLFAVAAALGRAERSRLGALADLQLSSPHRPVVATGYGGRLWERTRTPSRWVEIAYLCLVVPVLAVLGVLALAVWAAALTLLLLPAYVDHLAAGRAQFGLFSLAFGPRIWIAAAVGLVGVVLIAPWLTVGAAALDRSVARRMLGPSARTILAAQVRVVETRREAAVESAETERRHIERDLHDGAQQRLVALAMDLGRAREHFDADPERARALIGDAHDEAKAALAELRDLVRGLHPAVLSDRGLDAALSAVVARVPIPVDLSVDVSRRAPAAVESAAYFIVTEALTNAVRHAEARRLRVTVARAAGRLIVEVTDDGVGGADPDRGTGLTGLTGRVEALGGWLRVVSPTGGPTTIMAELPCAS
jgi:signal transduction histidine kinase